MTMIDNPTWTLSERLRRARLLAGLEQKDVAAALGVNRATVSLWETGKTEPSASNFVRWAQLTGQPIEWLAEGVVRPEGLEPPTFWSVADSWDATFWSIIRQAKFDTESTHTRGLA